MKFWKITVNGVVLVCFVGAAMTYIHQDYRIGVAGWLLAIMAFVSWERG